MDTDEDMFGMKKLSSVGFCEMNEAVTVFRHVGNL